MSVTHDLKTWPQYFAPVWDGVKTFEVRIDDRGFQTGDLLALSEFDPARDCTCRDHSRTHDRKTCTRYTGRVLTAEIGYVLSSTPKVGNRAGWQGAGYVVLALVNQEQFTTTYATGGPLPSPALTFSGAVLTGAELRFGPGLIPAAERAGRDLEIPVGTHATHAANCLLAEGETATNITCSPCQRAQLARGHQ